MQYQGEPMSAILRTSNISQIEGAEDNNIWGYFPLWPGGSRDPLPHTPETTRQLKAKGYEECTNPALKPILSTICYDVRITQEESGTLHDWARGVTPIGDAPVVMLCHSISNCPPENIRSIPILNPLPMPQHGESALVFDTGTSKFHLYAIGQLPEPARQLRERIKEKITTLSYPAKWPAFTEHHQVASDKAKCRQMLDTLYTRKMLAAGDPKLYEQTEMLEKALWAAQSHIRDLKRLLTKPNFDTEWEELQGMVYQLAKAYSAYHDTALTGAKQKPVPAIADIFAAGDAEILTALPFQAYPAASISRIEDWQQEPSEKEHEVILSYQYKKPSGTTCVQLRGDATGTTRDAVMESFRKLVQQLSDLDADVFLAMVCQLTEGATDSDGNTWISAQRLLDYRGIEPKMNKTETGGTRIAGHRREDIEAISQCVKRMENMFMKIQEMEIIDEEAPASKRKRARKTISRESRLFMFGDTIYHNELPLEEDAPRRSTPIAWQYRQSSWMVPFLSGPNRFTGVLIQKTLNYDPYHEQWEKRLARYFMFWLRTNASRTNKPSIVIGKLLEELNLSPDERYPEKTRSHFYKAMDRLEADGHFTWKRKFKDKDLPARKWMATWLQQEISVEDSALTKSQYNTIETTAKVLKALESPRPTKQHKRSSRKSSKGRTNK